MAATSMVFVGWNMPRVGHEAEAIEHFATFTNYLGQLQNQGMIENYEPIQLTPYGGDFAGGIIVRGDVARLHEMRRSELFMDHVTKANYLIEGIAVVDGYCGEGVRKQFGRYQKFIRR